MNSIDLIYLIPLLVVLVSFAYFILSSKKIKEKTGFKWLKYVPLISVILFISGVVFITDYYEKQLYAQNQRLETLEQQLNLNDSIYLNNESIYEAIDNLVVWIGKLDELREETEMKERITGSNPNVSMKISQEIAKANEAIGVIRSYNEIIDLNKPLESYISSGNSSNFIFRCPKDLTSEFLDLKLKFQDEKLISKIAFIMINISEIKENGERWLVFRQTYKPQGDVNAFKIRNYLKKDQTILEIGYILKSELENETPRFEKVTCQ